MGKSVQRRGMSWLLAIVMVLSMFMYVPGGSVTSQAATTKAYVKALTVKSSVSVNVEAKATVKPTVTVSGSASKSVTVKSSNTKVAKVSYKASTNTITITGVKPGTATITVTTVGKGSSGKKISKKITVKVNPYVKSLSLNKSSLSVNVDSSSTVTPTIAVVGSASKDFTVKSSNTSVAKVVKKSGKVVITGVKPGTANITVTTSGKTKAGKKISKVITVTVKPYVKSLSVSSSSVSVNAGSKKTVTPTVTVVGSASKNVTVKSSDTSVATVSNSSGKLVITGVKAGTAKITVTTVGTGKTGKKISKVINVTVKEYVTLLELGAEALSVCEGSSKTVTVAVDAVGTPSKDVTVKSSDTDVATVSASNGEIVVTGVKAGTATITVTTVGTTSDAEQLTKTIAVTVEPKLESISVTADTTSIVEKGGQAKLTVASATPGADIEKIEYKTSNSQLATVDEDGVVTGVNYNAAPVTITVTAYDKNGNAATNTISITVTQLKTATITLPDEDKTASLYVSETKTLKPTVADAEVGYVVDWTSTNDSVASVDNGVITAKAAGTATITAVVRGTNASVSCVVTVKSEAPGIKKFEATHADTFTVTLTAPVAEADRSKVAVSLKLGDKDQTFTTEWASDGKSFDLKGGSEYAVGTYTVAISGTDIAIDTAKASATTVVKDREISNIEITTDYVPYYSNTKIEFNALDQYGDVMQNVLANQFTWNVSCAEKANVDATGAVFDLTNKGYIYVNTKLENLEADKDELTVFAYLTSDSSINTTKKVAVKSLAIQSVKITGTKATKIYQSDKTVSVELTYEATDNLGGAVDFTQYAAYTSIITSTTSEAKICSKPEVSSEGKLIVEIQPNVSGSAKITVLGKDNVLSEYTIVVLEAPYAHKVSFPAASEISVVAGEQVKIPVSFIDQYGDAMDAGAVTSTAFTDAFDITVSGFSKELSASDITYVTSSEGDYLVVNTKSVTKGGTAKITLSSTEDSVTSVFNLEVTAPRAASKIKVTSEPQTTIMVGQTTKVEFEIQDAYGTAWTDKDTYKLEIGGATSGTYISTGEPVIDDNGKGYVAITGIASTAQASAQSVTLALKDTAGAYITTTNIEYAFTVNNNVDTIVATADKSEYTAGTDVKITLIAKNGGNKLETYNETIKGVTITESTNGTKTIIPEVQFTNGEAVISVSATVAAENVTYSGSITSPGNAAATTFETSSVKIVPGAAAKFSVTQTSRTVLSVSYVDTKGNVVNTKNIATATAVIKVTDANDNDVTSTCVDGIDASNQIIVDFVDGVATITAKKTIPSTYKISFSYGGLTN